MSPSDTREKIVAQARTLFAEKGFDGATTAAIARRAGIAEGTIYRHFGSKEELFLACVAPALEADFIDQSLERIGTATDLPGMIRAAVAARVQLVQENLESFNILFGEMSYHPELAERYFQRYFVVWAEKAAPVFLRVMASGQVKHPPNFLIFGLGMTVMIWSMLTFRDRMGAFPLPLPIAGTTANLLDDLTDFVLYGIAGQPPGGEV